MRGRKPITPEAALIRMADLCARSEQCSADIEGKLLRLGLSRAQAQKIVGELRDGRFIDDGRYARAFIEDKVRFNGWGPLKIRAALAAKRLSGTQVEEAIGEVEEEAFLQAAMEAGKVKVRTLDLTVPEDRMKLTRFLASRGFTSSQVSAVVRKLKEL